MSNEHYWYTFLHSCHFKCKDDNDLSLKKPCQTVELFVGLFNNTFSVECTACIVSREENAENMTLDY